MATEQFDIENVAEFIHRDEKWIFGNIKGKNDIYGAKYRECIVIDQTTIEDDTGDGNANGEQSNIGAIQYKRQWFKKDQMMFPLFKFTVDAQDDNELADRYISAFNSQRPENIYSHKRENWLILLNFMGDILDNSPVRDPYDYDSDDDEWADYESHKRRSDYGCQRGCCGEVTTNCGDEVLPTIRE